MLCHVAADQLITHPNKVMMIMSLLIDEELHAIEAGIDAGNLAHAHVRMLIAELKLTRQHLDSVIAAYQQPGIGPLVNACRVAKEWRGNHFP